MFLKTLVLNKRIKSLIKLINERNVQSHKIMKTYYYKKDVVY